MEIVIHEESKTFDVYGHDHCFTTGSYDANPNGKIRFEVMACIVIECPRFSGGGIHKEIHHYLTHEALIGVWAHLNRPVEHI